MAQAMGNLAMDSAMLHSASLKLIDQVCAAFELARSEDANLAFEIMRVIRAIAINGRVVLLADGPAAELLKLKFPTENILWNVVSVENYTEEDS